ncbi:2Fe-2S iron-sulfur cluster-binding protein [Neptunomonas sp.]|uniref:2Fe-2S iron-sulfur cluster-binding protein n=1 Tax=Neptunomonas sp. TaxID=1971898 RepID=UPI0025F1314E|nr:2Fe-2S iron-sulfur cluster-binding protein [Neptunomonas sp.]
MGHKFAEIAFTESVRDVQQQLGSRTGYASMDEGEDYNHLLSQHEADFINDRDSFYMASVSETGWPYVQHRGGPAGFIKIIDAQTIGFADFSGNRQYVSVGNLRKDNRVSLFLMDYKNRRRLKVLGRVRLIGIDETELLAALEVDDYRARVERGFVIDIEAFDWNCPQHITPRYTEADVEAILEAKDAELAAKTVEQTTHNQANTLSVLGHGELLLMISGVRQLTPRVRAYELRSLDGSELPTVKAGSHLRVPVRLENGELSERHYSICSNPARRDVYEIAVLKEPQGTGGSKMVHERFDIGLQLNCDLPQNNFSLHTDARPAVLIAGGIGITPLKAMAQALKARGNELQLHYAGRSEAEMAFSDRLTREFSQRLTLYRATHSERLNVGEVLSAAPDDVVIYVCGPNRLIDDVVKQAEALNISPERIRFERFSATPAANAQPIEVELRRSGVQIHVSSDQSILDAMLDAGVDAPFSCMAGVCKSCAVTVLEGEPEHRDSVLTPAEQQTSICPCISRAKGERLVLDI